MPKGRERASALAFMTRRTEAWYVAFAAANFVMGLSSILVPLKLDRVLVQGPGRLGILSTAASSAAVLGSLVWGRLSDAVHRRKSFVVLSYAAIGCAHIGLALASSFATLLLSNTLLSFFWVANASVAVLLVIEHAEHETWEMRISALNLSGAAGWLLGLIAGGIGVTPTLATFSDRLGLQVILVALAAIAWIAAGLGAWLVPGVLPKFTERRFRGFRIALGNLLTEAWRYSPLHLYHRFSLTRLLQLRRETRLFLLASFFAFTGIGFFAVPLPLLLSQHLGYAPSRVFYSYVMLHAGIVIAYPLALHRIKKRGNRQVQIGALSARILLFILAGIVLWSSIRVSWMAAMPFMFSVGVSWSFFQLSGVALASRLARPENRGLALGTYNAVAGVSTVIAGVSSGFLAQNVGHFAAYGMAAILLVCAVFTLVRLPDPMKLAEAERELSGEDVDFRMSRPEAGSAGEQARETEGRDSR